MRPSHNLDQLLRYNVDRLLTVQAWFETVDPGLFADLPEQNRMRWEVRDGTIALAAAPFRIKIIDDRRKTKHLDERSGRTPLWEPIRRRLARYFVEGVDFLSPGARVGVESVTSTSLTVSKDVDLLTNVIGRSAFVRRASIRTVGSHTLVCDFGRSLVDSASAIGPRILILVAADLLGRSDEDLMHQLRVFLGEPNYDVEEPPASEPEDEAPSLFD